MINLISEKNKKAVVENFYFRFFITFLNALSCCIFIGTIVLLPSYFFSLVKKNTINQKLEIQKKELELGFYQQTASLLQKFNDELSLIEKAETNKFQVSENMINKILSKKTADIKINHFLYENNPADSRKIIIDGFALNQEKLRLFSQGLREGGIFSIVELLVSDFTKGSRTEFHLELTLL